MNWILGYYICEKMKVPDWLGIERDTMLSVSNCFDGVHPGMTKCFFVNSEVEARAQYRKKWDLDDNKAAMLQKDIENIFGSALAIDGRFLKLADAEYFYKCEPVEWVPCRIGSCLLSTGFQKTMAYCCGQEVSR